MKKLGMSVAGLVMAAAFAAPAQANLVTNGGFEMRDFSGWTQTGDSVFNGVLCDTGDSAIHAGSCSAYLGSYDASGIEQSINVGAAGLAWNLSFAFKSESGSPSNFSVLFDGQTLLSLADPSAGDYTLFHFSGLTTGENMTLAFNFFDQGFGNVFLDAVSVTTAPAEVPEPATLALMGAGLAGLLFSRRRKTKA